MNVELARIILQPGVCFAVPGNKYRSGFQGQVIKVSRVNFTYFCEMKFAPDGDIHRMTFKHSLSDVDGIRAANKI